MKTETDNVVQLMPRSNEEFKLIVDNENSVAMSDRPVFGSAVTLDENLPNKLGDVLPAHSVIGWLDYVDVSKFACINHKQQYVCASNFLYTLQNQLITKKDIKLISFDKDMNTSKILLIFNQA